MYFFSLLTLFCFFLSLILSNTQAHHPFNATGRHFIFFCQQDDSYFTFASREDKCMEDVFICTCTCVCARLCAYLSVRPTLSLSFRVCVCVCVCVCLRLCGGRSTSAHHTSSSCSGVRWDGGRPLPPEGDCTPGDVLHHHLPSPTLPDRCRTHVEKNKPDRVIILPAPLVSFSLCLSHSSLSLESRLRRIWIATLFYFYSGAFTL